MGKIRIKTLGDEEKEEKKQKKEAQQRSQAKKAQALAEKTENTTPESPSLPKRDGVISGTPEKPAEKIKQKTKNKKTRSTNYLTIAKKIEKNKNYNLTEALQLLSQLKRAKFDETVELHINTTEKGVTGSVTLPHGTGKQIRVEILNQSDNPKHVEETIKKLEAGQIEFDVLIATPDSMPKLAKVARISGPKGLMPNPKTGTVTPKPETVAEKFKGGQINFKTEAKSPIIHLAIGKISFGDKKLTENIQTAINAIQTKNIKNATLKSTMSPAIKLDTATL